MKKTIINIKKKIGLKSDADLAVFLGVGSATVTRLKAGDKSSTLFKSCQFISLILDKLTQDQITETLAVMDYIFKERV